LGGAIKLLQKFSKGLSGSSVKVTLAYGITSPLSAVVPSHSFQSQAGAPRVSNAEGVGNVRDIVAKGVLAWSAASPQ
jgi:hypothetical protein